MSMEERVWRRLSKALWRIDDLKRICGVKAMVKLEPPDSEKEEKAVSRIKVKLTEDGETAYTWESEVSDQKLTELVLDLDQMLRYGVDALKK